MKLDLRAEMMRNAFDRLKAVRAVVIGDCMIDRYVIGEVSRISPEAPIPIVSLTRQYETLGGAANVAAGLASLGVHTQLAGIVGDDNAGKTLLQAARGFEIDTELVAREQSLTTILKSRIIGQAQQIVRVDDDGCRIERERHAEGLMDAVLEELQDVNVIVLADYDKGTLPPSAIRRLLAECRRRNILTVVDPKKRDFGVYAQAGVLTPNLFEFSRAIGLPISKKDALGDVAVEWHKRLDVDYLAVTCGADGMFVLGRDQTIDIAAEVRRVADVTGAGDTVVSILAACLGAGWSISDACRLASCGAGISVSNPRTYVVAVDELRRGWEGISPKLLSLEEARSRIDQLRNANAQIVFTNGCFDILHAGHLTCLEGAKRLGDALIVGLNSDASVRRLKGDSRPRISQSHRAALLAGLECVDMVLIFDEDSPLSLLQQLRPDILVKGGDYEASQIVGREVVNSYGGKVVILPLVEGLSTTAILAE